MDIYLAVLNYFREQNLYSNFNMKVNGQYTRLIESLHSTMQECKIEWRDFPLQFKFVVLLLTPSYKGV